MSNQVTTQTIYVTKIKRGKEPNSKLITELLCTKDETYKLLGTSWETRETIISEIKNNSEVKYYTYSHEDGSSAKIEVNNIKGVDYLTTEKNDSEKDNLGNLPVVK